MIQRIQSLYLLIVAILSSVMLFLPLAEVTGDANNFIQTAFAFKSESSGEIIYPTYYMGGLIAITTLLSVVTIFLFKNRMLQIRLCITEIVLLVGTQIFAAYYLWMLRRPMEIFQIKAVGYSVVDIFPAISIVFTILALRGIIRDQTLIKSLNRIR